MNPQDTLLQASVAPLLSNFSAHSHLQSVSSSVIHSQQLDGSYAPVSHLVSVRFSKMLTLYSITSIASKRSRTRLHPPTSEGQISYPPNPNIDSPRPPILGQILLPSLDPRQCRTSLPFQILGYPLLSRKRLQIPHLLYIQHLWEIQQLFRIHYRLQIQQRLYIRQYLGIRHLLQPPHLLWIQHLFRIQHPL